jgi:hypothetical protein
MNHWQKIFLSLSLVVILSLMASFALAQTTGSTTSTSSDTAELPNPLGTTDLSLIIGKIIRGVLDFLGVLALVMFIWGGIQWMTSGGSEEKIKSGRDTMVWAALGLALIFASYSILNFVFSIIFKSVSPTP